MPKMASRAYTVVAINVFLQAFMDIISKPVLDAIEIEMNSATFFVIYRLWLQNLTPKCLCIIPETKP